MSNEGSELGELLSDIDAVASGRVKWWKTRRMWGLLTIAVSFVYNSVAAYFGLPQVEITVSMLEVTPDQLFGVAGFILAAVGSIKANKPVSLLDIAPGVSLSTTKKN